MRYALDRTGEFPRIAQLAHRIAQQDDVAGLLILAAGEADPGLWNDLLAKLPVPAFGGFFPAIIENDAFLRCGAILLGLPHAPTLLAIPSLNDRGLDLHTLLQTQNIAPDAQLAMVLLDGWARRIDDLVDALFDHLGMSVPVIGGGAGTLESEQEPCLITPWGLQAEGAIIALFDVHAAVGAGHGWQAIAGPFEVTEARDNVVLGLDWMPALEVYRQVVEPRAGRLVTAESFFDVAKAFPFGMARLDAEFVVRDPIRIEQEHGLRCVGNVPLGSLVHILHGQPDVLVDAALKARRMAEQRFPQDSSPRLDLAFDCISRALFLESRYANELAALNSGRRPLLGALTLGEIAGHGCNYLEFHNKTTVVAVLGETR